MTPQIADLVNSSAVTYRQPTLTYRMGDNLIVGKTDGLDAVRQSVRHILCTERYSSRIYDDGYGVELEQYLGKDFGTLLAGIEETLRDALTQDDRITDIRVDDVSQVDGRTDECKVKFTVDTIYGSVAETFNVPQ